MILRELISEIENFAPLHYQESYDNSGLLVGNPDLTVIAALLTLDVTEDVVEEAISKGCNLIIAHHPIIFSGLKKLNGKNYVERSVIKAIKNDIAVYASHTNLDNVNGGVNFKIAEKLKLQNVAILSPKKQQLENSNFVGGGAVGDLETPIKTTDFLSYLKKNLEVSVIRHTDLLSEKISKVAVCGGSGSFMLQDAIAAGADIFITADFKYHEFFDAEDKIIIADIGHFESEQFTKELLQDIICQKFPNFATYLSEVNTNPIQYFY
ncbi:MAG: Nif3-like dinuclear metal center hexameric protein [Spirosomaceae bacterium]|nr:Nif3-like dinuclear metal center hexameric protein [Spirosomataceae bacterium]